MAEDKPAAARTIRCAWCGTSLHREDAAPIPYARLPGSADEENMQCADAAACDRRQDALSAACIARARAAGLEALFIRVTPGIRAVLDDGERLCEASALLGEVDGG